MNTADPSSFDTTLISVLSDPESISMANNNVVINNGSQQQQQQQQQQHQQQLQQQPLPYHDPPYMIRHSRAFRHFKNPPQPHMCIKDHTEDGQELFINVMKWTKICMPHSASDPIPLYGGMRVTSGSPKAPALVFAVMANPAILKHVGRKCSDVEEKYALVKLMCDFVEAMNPGLKLARDAEVLKDRDLSGELKDIWGAVQAKRLREKDAAPSYENYLATQNQIYIDFGPETSYQSPSNNLLVGINANEQQQQQQQQQHNATNNTNSQLISVLNVDEMCGTTAKMNANVYAENLTNIAAAAVSKSIMPTTVNVEIVCDKNVGKQSAVLLTDNTSNNVNKANGVVATATATAIVADTHNSNNSSSNNHGNTTTTTTGKSIKTNAVSVPKKDKLAGFLPNGCHNIFPFIKTKNSHDKNSNKDKSEQNSNSSMAVQHVNGSRKSQCSNKDTKYIQNNTANLECELSKIDLSK